ncbi:MAG: membrane protein [Comamonadaceae bacterium BICA1-1]|nr:MAG: membrane protein [Comamonadaceae bacterium BICA1-1]
MLVGSLFVALAVLMFQQALLLTGGTTGLAFLLHYALAWPLGWLLFVLNLPFYVFAWLTLGPVFTLKTFVAVALLALWVQWLPLWLGFDRLHPVLAAVLAGLLAGTGILMLLRHHASLGGIGILAVYLQKRLGWRAGLVQMGFDVLLLLVAFMLLPPKQVLLSLLGALSLNMVIAVNHRSGRYMGV